MVTRQLVDDTSAARRELFGLTQTVRGSVLPVLSLAGAYTLLNSNLNQTTAAGMAASSAGYGLQVSMYGLQDSIANAMIPVIEEVTPHLSAIIDKFVEWDEETDGLSTRIGLLGGAALIAAPRILSLLGAAGRATPILAAAAAAAGIAYQEYPEIKDDVAAGDSLTDIAVKAGARTGATIAAGVVTGIQAAWNNDPREFGEFGDRNRRWRQAVEDDYDRRQAAEDERRFERDQPYGGYFPIGPMYYGPGGWPGAGDPSAGVTRPTDGGVTRMESARAVVEMMLRDSDAFQALMLADRAGTEFGAIGRRNLSQLPGDVARSPAAQMINYITVQGYTNDDLLRQIREFFQQGAIQVWQ